MLNFLAIHSLKSFTINFLHFGLKELRACVFAGSFFAVLFVSRYLNLLIPRYDFLLIAAVVLQILMLVFRLETPKELLAITMFHVIGLMLELYKTSPAVGSWNYPEFAYTKLYTVPLYSGFMYAAVGSYIMQAWRLFNLRVTPPVSRKTSLLLCFLIYLNFSRTIIFTIFAGFCARRSFSFIARLSCILRHTSASFVCRSCLPFVSSGFSSGSPKISRPSLARGNTQIKPRSGTSCYTAKFPAGFCSSSSASSSSQFLNKRIRFNKFAA
nr:DUF817 family protein [uncultured Campylobacter sp.]